MQQQLTPIRFGPTAASPVRNRLQKDVYGDGDDDVILLFRI